ncbi:MAG TPA: hypothetical protein VM120_09330 [Bryobacteraceae bacterium]|nr:hypothetical protein [Bryobacteraceae bacterium]
MTSTNPVTPNGIRHIDHASQKLSQVKAFPDRLHVVAVLHNPLRWRSRYDHFSAFEKRVTDSGGLLYVVEVAIGDREFEVVDAANPRHLGLRSYHELWHKERQIKLAIQHLLPNDWERVAWVDADVQFSRPDVMQETLQQLEHFHFVQMFSHAQDLGPNFEPLWTTPGFMYEWVNHGALGPAPWKSKCYYDAALKPWSPFNADFDKEWRICHPGLAWAASREALDYVGGIFDKSIFGSGDFVMACALVGRGDLVLSGLDPGTNEFARAVMHWQKLCETHVHRDVGFVPGMVSHFWHGRKADRRYANRPGAVLVDLGFDPRTDIKEDSQGLYQLSTDSSDRSRRLRDTLRMFARCRNEDCNEV